MAYKVIYNGSDYTEKYCADYPYNFHARAQPLVVHKHVVYNPDGTY